MSLGLLNLTILAGLAALVVPVLIHLLNRRRCRVVDWGAMQFLQVSQARRRRLLLEELLLLALRMGLIALLVLALAGPFVAGPAVARLASRPPRDIVLVLDGSASMGRRDGTHPTPRELARAWAGKLLGELSPEDNMTVLLAGERAADLTGGPTRDPRRVRDALERWPESAGGCDGPRGAEAAIGLLRERGVNAEQDVIFLADGHRIGWAEPADLKRWEQLASRLRDRAASGQATPRLWYADVTGGPPTSPVPNVGVAKLDAPELAWVGQPVRLRAALTSQGSDGKSGGKVILEVDGQAVQTLPLESQAVTFTHRFDKPGSHLLTVRVEPGPGTDRVPADDRRDWAVTVREALPVLFVDGDDELSPESATFFLRQACAPVSASAAPAVRAAAVPLPRFDPALLDGPAPGGRPRVLVLADVPRLGDSQVAAVERFLNDGGGVWVILGPRVVDAASYNRSLFRDGRGWLPAGLLAVTPVLDDAEKAAAPDVSESSHPALAVFRDRPNCTLGTARLPRWWRVAPPAAPAVTVARLDNGDPLLVERPFGQGRVLLSTVPFDRGFDSTLPRVWEYPVLVHELLYHLAGAGEDRRNVSPGEPLTYRPAVAPSAPVTVERPDGEREPVKSEGGVLRYDRTERPGVYRFDVPGEAAAYFTVQGDPAESTLTYLTDAERQALAAAGLRLAESPGVVSAAVVDPNHREDLWWLVLVGVTLLLCVELWLTRRMAAARA